MREIIKSEYEEIKEGLNYEDLVAPGERLSTSTWEFPSGLIGTNAEIDDRSTQVEITGGTATTSYTVTNKVEATNGERFQRSFKVLVRNR